jgi:hypothetical protein
MTAGKPYSPSRNEIAITPIKTIIGSTASPITPGWPNGTDKLREVPLHVCAVERARRTPETGKRIQEHVGDDQCAEWYQHEQRVKD